MNKERYYTSYSNYPDQVIQIAERIKIYMCSKLFYEEEYSESASKFIYADIGNDGSDEGIRRATELFGSSNQSYPFTAYSFGEEEILRDKRTAYAKNMIYYNDYIGSFVSAKPAILYLPMISFYNTPYDYQIAKKVLFEISSAPIKLDVPVVIGDVTTTFPVHVTFETIEKGNYAFNFQEMLRAGDIYDIQHFAKIEYHDMETSSVGIYPVEDMVFELWRLAEEDKSLSDSLDDVTIDYITQLSSSNPTNGATDVPVDNSVILTFNVGMEENSVTTALTLDPYFSADYTWDDDSKNLVIDPVENLTSGTVYNVYIDDTAYSWFNNESIYTDDYSSGQVHVYFVTE